MARNTKEEAAKTRAAIMAAAEKCFYTRGVVRTSLQEIALNAGVTRGAVYWHFKDKVALLRAIADNIFLPHEALLERLATEELKDPLGDLCKVCLEALKSIAHNKVSRRVFTILTQRCEYVEEMASMIARNQDCRRRSLIKLTEIFKQAQRKKMLSLNWTPQTAAGALQGMFLGFIIAEMEWPRSSTARDKAHDEIINTFFKALRR